VGAQPQTKPTISWLDTRPGGPAREFVEAFRRGLAEVGFSEGRDVTVEYHTTDGHDERLPSLAADLVRQRPVTIIASGTITALAAKTATRDIPIIFAVGADPVELGLVASLNRPGRNLTGNATLSFEIAEKRIELLHKAVPAVETIALLVGHADDPFTQFETMHTQSAARTLGLRLLVFNITTDADVALAFAKLIEQQAGAIVVGANVILTAKGVFARRSAFRQSSGSNLMSRTEPGWMAGLRAAQRAPRCGAWAKSASRPCRHLAMQNGRCYYHGGVNPGAPPQNTNSVSSGRYMMEDAVAAKANTAISRAIRGMIKNAMTGYEKQLPAAVVHAQHKALLHQIADAQLVQQQAAKQKAERLKAHDERLERRRQRLAGKSTQRDRSEPAQKVEGEPVRQQDNEPGQRAEISGPKSAGRNQRAGTTDQHQASANSETCRVIFDEMSPRLRPRSRVS
jgi:putative ABC transport system substrate-binding protein